MSEEKNVELESVKEVYVEVDQKTLDYLYLDLKYLIEETDDKELTAINFAMVCISLMQTVSELKEYTGKQKKKLVMDVFKRYIADDSNPSNLSLELLPGLIDALIQIDNGDVSIKTEIEPEKCMARCLPFLCAVASAEADKRRQRRRKK